jgi:hypothetical protein
MPMEPLPSWIDPEAFSDYLGMRKRIKKPMTDRRMRQFMARLYELHQKGHDVNACLDAATDHQWLDAYPVSEKHIPNQKTGTDSVTEAMRQAREASQTPEAIKAREACLPALKLVRAKLTGS